MQLCVVHQIRNSKKYIAWKDVKAFMQDLKHVYRARTKELAEANLDKLDARWGAKYPVVIASWRRNWERLSVYFAYAPELRRVIYTTNITRTSSQPLRSSTEVCAR